MGVNSPFSVSLQDAQLMAIVHGKDGDGWQDFPGMLSSASPREKDLLQSQLFFVFSFQGWFCCTGVFCLSQHHRMVGVGRDLCGSSRARFSQGCHAQA